MATLRNDTVIRSADGQGTSAIVTAANIGSYGIATNSTYYVGTTQNIFNRASGAQTLTGVSIDGNAANITAYTINQNVGTANAPSFAGATLTSTLSITGGDGLRAFRAGAATVTSHIYWANTTNTVAYNWQLDENNNAAMWGYTSAWGKLLTVTSAGAFSASGDVRAPIFYDSANTAYYLDPASTSNLVGLTVANTITGSVSGSSASCTGNAATATTSALLTSSDVRTISPSSANAGRLTYGFTSYANNNTGSWADYLHLRSYTDGTGGNDNLVMFNKSAIGMRIWQQAFGSATAYATYKDVAFTDQGFYIGTTSVAINRSSASQTLTGVSIDGNAATVTNGLYTSSTLTAGNLSGTIPSGVLGNSTHYVGTTAIALNRASAGQTLTGISIDGNSGGIYAAGGAYIQTTSTGTSYGSHIQVREAAGGGGLTSEIYAPALGFHWAAVVASNILMESSGRIAIRDNPGTGYENFIANIVYGNASVRSPIFYDSNDTTYYLDPANTGTALAIAGNAGVGTASPTLSSGKGLHINSSSGHANLKLQSSGRTWELLSTTGAYFSLYDTTGGADRLTVTSGGNVGVATTTADTNLQVVGHVHVGNQTTFENAGGWNKTIYLDGLVHARMRILGSAYASGKNSATETYIWVDNSVAPYSGLATNAGSFQISAGFTTLTNSARSPIFYDSDNTSYYIDAASTSNLNALTIAGNSTFSADSYLTFGPNSSWSRYLRIGGNGYTAPVTTTASVVTTNGNLHLDAAKAAGMAIYLNWYGGAGGTIFGNGSGTQVGAVDSSGNTSFSGTLSAVGAISQNGNQVLNASNYVGYSAFTGSVTSTYGNFTAPGLIIGDAQYGFYVSGGNVYYKSASGGVHYWRNIANSANTMSLDNSGNILLSGYVNASSYVYSATYLQTGGNLIYPSGYGSTQRLEVGNSANNNWIDGLTIAPGGTVTAPDNMRSPIFYDSNNTGYYLDPQVQVTYLD